MRDTIYSTEVFVDADATVLPGALSVPEPCRGIVVFAHGSGSSRFSPRNQSVARALQQRGLATLLFDLLTGAEHRIDQQDAHLRFDIALLSRRLTGAVDWLSSQELPPQARRCGLFGASTGAAAALVCAAQRPREVAAVVSRGGRPDLAGAALGEVRAPTLLIVGGNDPQVIACNEDAQRQLRCPSRLVIVPGATHLFEEPGTLEQVADLAGDWMLEHLSAEH